MHFVNPQTSPAAPLWGAYFLSSYWMQFRAHAAGQHHKLLHCLCCFCNFSSPQIKAKTSKISLRRQCCQMETDKIKLVRRKTALECWHHIVASCLSGRNVNVESKCNQRFLLLKKINCAKVKLGNNLLLQKYSSAATLWPFLKWDSSPTWTQPRNWKSLLSLHDFWHCSFSLNVKEH